jgi:hypothetical protein
MGFFIVSCFSKNPCQGESSQSVFLTAVIALAAAYDASQTWSYRSRSSYYIQRGKWNEIMPIINVGLEEGLKNEASYSHQFP